MDVLSEILVRFAPVPNPAARSSATEPLLQRVPLLFIVVFFVSRFVSFCFNLAVRMKHNQRGQMMRILRGSCCQLALG
jgi:hypothetical protein